MFKEFKETISILFSKANTLQHKRAKKAFWYGFRNPFRKISSAELENYLKDIK